MAFVTNIEIEDRIKSIFLDNGVLILNCPFDAFKFDDEYTWCLAFYKLCVLKYAGTLDYDQFLCIDSDTYCRSNFSFLWKNIGNNIVLYDRVGSTMEPLGSLKNLKYLRTYYLNRIQRVGGEFFAANKNSLMEFVHTADFIFRIMVDENIRVKTGDEYITSLAQGLFENIDYSGERYLTRIETGWYRDNCDVEKIKTVPIWHIPSEKKKGLLRVYEYLEKSNNLPNEDEVIKFCYIKKRRFLDTIKSIFKKYGL